MNIFVLDEDLRKCAEYHCDKHVTKMILEYAQLLSTAHRVLDGKQIISESKSGRKQKTWILPDHREERLYKAVSVNHPCGIWVRQSRANYIWLHTLLTECLIQFYDRYEKEHKTSSILLDLFIPPNNIPDIPHLTPFAQAMPDECKVSGDAVQAYRNYYNMHKHRFAKWKNNNVPEWYSPVI